MHFLRILVGNGSRSHVLDGIDSTIAFKPARDSGSNFLNLEAHEDLTTFISTSSVQYLDVLHGRLLGSHVNFHWQLGGHNNHQPCSSNDISQCSSSQVCTGLDSAKHVTINLFNLSIIILIIIYYLALFNYLFIYYLFIYLLSLFIYYLYYHYLFIIYIYLFIYT